MKNTIIAAAIAVMTFVSTSATAEIRLIANEPGPNKGVRAKSVEYFGQLIEERSNGELVIDQNWGGALFKASAALPSISAGISDIGLVIGAYAPSEFPALALGDLPLAGTDAWISMQAMNELFSTNEQIKARMDDMGIVYLGPYATSQAQMGCRGEGMKSVESVKGTKMRYAGAVLGEMFSNLGGNMVNISIYKAFQGMETGLIDCTITYAYFAVATKLDELIDSLTPMEFSNAASLATFMNKTSYDGLSAEHQSIIQGVRLDVINYYSENILLADVAAMEKMTSGDDPIIVHKLNAADIAAMEEAAMPVFAKWKSNAEAKGYDADALLAEYKGLLEKWTEVRDTQGYPWTR